MIKKSEILKLIMLREAIKVKIKEKVISLKVIRLFQISDNQVIWATILQ